MQQASGADKREQTEKVMAEIVKGSSLPGGLEQQQQPALEEDQGPAQVCHCCSHRSESSSAC